MVNTIKISKKLEQSIAEREYPFNRDAIHIEIREINTLLKGISPNLTTAKNLLKKKEELKQKLHG